MERKRKLIFFRNHFKEFFESLNDKAKEKIDYVLFLVVLFNGFQKKSQKIPRQEIDKALRIRDEYFTSKNQNDEKRKRFL